MFFSPDILSYVIVLCIVTLCISSQRVREVDQILYLNIHVRASNNL